MSSQESASRTSQLPLRYEPPGWVHFIWLVYLGFLFTPLLDSGHDWTWFWPTVMSLPVFLALYAVSFSSSAAPIRREQRHCRKSWRWR